MTRPVKTILSSLCDLMRVWLPITNLNFREKVFEERFGQTSQMVMDIYRSWSLSDDSEESIVCSKQALEAWMSRHLTKPADRKTSIVVEG